MAAGVVQQDVQVVAPHQDVGMLSPEHALAGFHRLGVTSRHPGRLNNACSQT